MIKFDSDYVEGCIPEILEALAASNEEQTSGYGIDPHCDNARELIRKACKAGKADVQFVVGGTQANIIVLNSLRTAGAGFRTATNQVTIFAKDGREFASELKSKQEIAEEILQTAQMYIQQ